MRQLHPRPIDDVDLATAYAFPAGQRWVRANMVSSVDGAGAIQGATKRLSGPADQRAFGVLRQLADVVLVGAGTARAERYRAEPAKAEHVERRLAAGQTPAPAIAVVSKSLALDPRSGLFVDGPVRTIVITCATAPSDRRSELERVADVIEAGNNEVDLAVAVDALHARGLDRVSCEGGPRLLGQLVAAGRLDELCFTLSPCLVGGAPPRLLGEQALAQQVQLQLAQLLEADGYLFTRYLVDRS